MGNPYCQMNEPNLKNSWIRVKGTQVSDDPVISSL